MTNSRARAGRRRRQSGQSVTGERIRDKIAASERKGCGSAAPLRSAIPSDWREQRVALGFA
ncbi:MAG: hypothetical protein JWR00_2022 [Rubritepida sp.]|nr:hypothetical protein [Rubritepida sp.]